MRRQPVVLPNDALAITGQVHETLLPFVFALHVVVVCLCATDITLLMCHMMPFYLHNSFGMNLMVRGTINGLLAWEFLTILYCSCNVMTLFMFLFNVPHDVFRHVCMVF